METNNFFIYLLVMAGVTYLLRAVPLFVIKKRIKNKYIVAFLHFIPYSVLTVMTVPAIFYITENVISGIIGFIAAVLLSQKTSNLVIVAVISSFCVCASEIIINYL